MRIVSDLVVHIYLLGLTPQPSPSQEDLFNSRNKLVLVCLHKTLSSLDLVLISNVLEPVKTEGCGLYGMLCVFVRF